MNQNIKLSIIVPVYNVEKYLRQCLDSLITQTLKEIEIICVNDGSTDSSLQILNEYEKKDARVHVISKENSGYGNTMNIGFSAASGEYVGIVESDDYALPEMFETLYTYAIQFDADIVKSNYYECKKDEELRFCEVLEGVTYQTVFCPSDCEAILQMPGSCIWSGIYKRTFIQENNIMFNETPGASYQDVSFQLLTLLYAKRMLAIKEAFLCYRIDNENSSVKSKEKVFYIMEEFKRWESFAQKECKEELIKKTYYKKYLNYLGNYYRVDDLFKYAFLLRMSQEFQEDKKRGWLDPSFWNRNDWNQMEYIRTNPTGFYKDTCESYQNKYVLDKYIYNEVAKQEGIERTLTESDNVIIYGAGKYGHAVYENIKGVANVLCFAVSEVNSARNMVEGLEVHCIDELLEYKDTSVVVVAVRKELQEQIVKRLYTLGFGKVLIVDRDYTF